MTDESPMPWGKHKGTPLGQVPGAYLDWLIGQEFLSEPRNAALRHYITEHEGAIRAELPDDD